MIEQKRGMLFAMRLWQMMVNPRSIWLLLAASAFNITYLASIHNALGKSDSMHFLTPLLLLMCSPQIFPSPHFFMSIFLFFLLAQIPQTDEGLYYHLIRMDKKKWLLQEISMIISINLIMIIITFLLAIIAMLPNIVFVIGWDSKLHVWQKMQQGTWNVMIPYALTLYESQIKVFVCAVVLWMFYGVFGGLLMLVSRLIAPHQRGIGLSVLFSIYFFDYICEYCLPYVVRYASPVALSRVSYLNWGYDPMYPSVKYAFLFWVVCCTILIIAIIYFGKKVDMDKLASRLNR